MELNEIISRIPKSRNTLLLNKSKVKSNNDLKKYTNKPSEELLKLVNAKKITDTDFCIILYNKLTNYIEKNKEDILNSNSQLSNDLKNFFLATPHSFDLYYSKYKKLKETIKKIKNENAKKTSIKNKIKKQSSHLLGDSKLKSLSKKDALHLEQMAKENRLTVPDFFNILKYKLTNEYFGTITEQIYKKRQDIFCCGNELQFFYSGFNFSKEKRQSEIKKIANFYEIIVNKINNTQIINFSYMEGGDGKSEKKEKTITLELKSYSNFKIELNNTKKNFDSFAAIVNREASNQKLINWYSDLEKKLTEEDKKSFGEQFQVLKATDTIQQMRTNGPIKKTFDDLYNEVIKDDKNSNYSFNTFKLLKQNTNENDLPSKPDQFFYITKLLISIKQFNEQKNSKSKTEDLYITKNTEDKIMALIQKKLKKVETNINKKQKKRPPMPLPPNKT